jgi:hypothetical protein
VVEKDGARVRVMAGDGALGQAAAGPIKMRNPGVLLDISLAPGAKFSQASRRCGVPPPHAFARVGL